MRTPQYLAPFDYELEPFFRQWPSHPAGMAAIAILTRLDNVERAMKASDEGRPALVEVQDELLNAISETVMNDRHFLRFVGHFQRRVMEQVGYELVASKVDLPQNLKGVFGSAALYRRSQALAA